MTPVFDIVIVSFNTQGDLVRCLESLAAAAPRGLRAISVVDNASTDGTVDVLRANWPRVAVTALDRNIGFGAANNVGMRAATSPLVLLLNADTLVPAGALDTLADRLIARDAVAVGPRLVDAEGRPELSFGPMLSPSGEALQKIRGRLAASGAGFARRYISGLLADERDVDWVSGACLMVRREAALSAGLFDERYFMYEEDVDFCAALRARGGRILFTPKAQIVHLRGRSLDRASGNRTTLYDRSHLAFYEKHAPGWAPWLRLWLRARGRGIR